MTREQQWQMLGCAGLLVLSLVSLIFEWPLEVNLILLVVFICAIAFVFYQHWHEHDR